MKLEKRETYSNISYFVSGVIGFFLAPTMLIGAIFLLIKTNLCVASYTYHKYKIGKIFLFDWHSIIVAYTSLAGILINNPITWLLLITYQAIYGMFIIGKLGVYKEVIIGGLPFVYAIFACLPWYQAVGILVGIGIAALIRNYDNSKNVREVYYDSRNHSWWHVITAFVPLLIFI